ncbi:hypothetical protein IPG41_06555 [Candidatus Peregrinibacteria bacterium]|nr:MAG: hypothetical protein IPG41_06555 [Candidatus Peregrinibacteria bacterium]
MNKQEKILSLIIAIGCIFPIFVARFLVKIFSGTQEALVTYLTVLLVYTVFTGAVLIIGIHPNLIEPEQFTKVKNKKILKSVGIALRTFFVFFGLACTVFLLTPLYKDIGYLFDSDKKEMIVGMITYDKVSRGAFLFRDEQIKIDDQEKLRAYFLEDFFDVGEIYKIEYLPNSRLILTYTKVAEYNHIFSNE